MVRGQLTTINLDNTVCLGKQQSDLLEVINTVGSDILLVQEARDTNLNKILPSTYATNQVMTNPGTRATAVIWKKSLFEEVESYLHIGSRSGQNDRYISRATLRNKSTSRRTKVASLHFPPNTDGGTLQGPMASNVIDLIKANKVPNFVIGGDWNFSIAIDKFNIRKKTGYISRYNKQDGFYLTDTMTVSAAAIGPRLNSDHRPVTITIDV